MTSPTPKSGQWCCARVSCWRALACIVLSVLFLSSFTCPPMVIPVPDSRQGLASMRNEVEDVVVWMMKTPHLAEARQRKKLRLIQVDRVDESELPFSKFYSQYALNEKPVVITNLKSFTKEWSIDHIKKVCGQSKVTPLVTSLTEGGWASSQPLNETTLGAFLDSYKTLPQPRPYLHDVSIPRMCPKLLNDYIVPRYVVQDYLAHGHEHDAWGVYTQPYATTWPSMFVGSEGSGGEPRVGDSDTHTTVHMLHGVKEFRFVAPHDRVAAYEDRVHGAIPSDLFHPDFEKFPLLSLAKVYETTLRPGELLFMPGGSAYQTVNGEGDAVAVGSNYVDASNLERCLTSFDEQRRHELSDDLNTRSVRKLAITRMDAQDVPWTNLFSAYAVP
ncbi:F-box protein [Diplonema papillatum]|nr:F-box protein [Diplonema papillatum]